MGGRVGLKGTDGLAAKAEQLGARPRAAERTAKALEVLVRETVDAEFMVAAGRMGEDLVRSNGLKYRLVYSPKTELTSAADTALCAQQMMRDQVNLILFAGGDGTARDICRVVGEKIPVLGIPAGVKIHSPVFGQTPRRAGELAHRYIDGRLTRLAAREVLDIDESLYRDGQVHTRLYGYLQVPVERTRMQNRKSGSMLSERAVQNTISLDVIDRMEKGVVYLIGPGSTTRQILENLGLQGSLLGVDLVLDGKIIGRDASEQKILEAIDGHRFKIIVTPIGGQGYLFGRGNHQLSPELIRLAGKDNIQVIATMEKITRLRGEPLLVDTGDEDVDDLLKGYTRVITGYNEEIVYRIR